MKPATKLPWQCRRHQPPSDLKFTQQTAYRTRSVESEMLHLSSATVSEEA